LSRAVRAVLAEAPRPAEVAVAVDVDPYDLL
jgi:hypothetical protein